MSYPIWLKYPYSYIFSCLRNPSVIIREKHTAADGRKCILLWSVLPFLSGFQYPSGKPEGLKDIGFFGFFRINFYACELDNSFSCL